MNDLTHLHEEYDKEIDEQDKEVSLTRLMQLVSDMNDLELAIKEKELELKEYKKKHATLNQELIPDIMLSQLGLTKLGLSDGRVVTTQEKISPTVKDWDTFLAFVTQHGDDALIDTTIKLGKLPENILNRVRAWFMEHLDMAIDAHQKIHHARMPGYIKELCYKEDAEYTLEELNELLRSMKAKRTGVNDGEDILKVYQFYTTKVK